MARIKYRGSRAAASKAAKVAPTSYKVYAGPQPPRGPYRLKATRMTVKMNKNNDPYFRVLSVIDEPVKKNGKTNPRAQYNGAFVVGSSNQTDEYAEIFNAFLQSMGCTTKDIQAIWNTGVETVDNPKGDDFVKTLGAVKINGNAALYFYGLVDLEIGNKKPTGGKYADKLSVGRFLTSKDIMGDSESSDYEDDDDDDDEDEDLDPDEGPDEDSDDEGEEGDDAYEERQSELEGMTRAAWRALLKELESDLVITAKVKDAQIVEEILALEFPEEEEEGDEEEDDDLQELDRTELKALIKEEKLEVKVLKSMPDGAIRDAIREARGGVEEEEDDPPAKPVSKRRSKSSAGEPPF